LLPANGKAGIAGVATAVGAMVGSGESAVNVVRVRKETDHRVENVAPGNLGIGHHVHKDNRATGHHAHKESAVNVVRVRKETDHKANRVSAVSDPPDSHVPRASDHPGRKANGASDHHASRANAPVEPSRLLQFSLRLMSHRHPLRQ
jgi:hypothetical protein